MIETGKISRVLKEVIMPKTKDNRADEIMQEIIRISKVPIKKLDENYYEFGSKKIYVKYDYSTDEMMVRDRGGRYIEVNHFLRDNEDREYGTITES